MRIRVWVMTILLCLTYSFFAHGAEPGGEIRQVSYRLQIVELSDADAKILGVNLASPSDVLEQGIGSITRLIQSPTLTQILQNAASLLELTAANVAEQANRVAEPHLTVAVGETGRFVVSHEEWTPAGSTGLTERVFSFELLLTPERVDRDGGSVLTRVELGTAANSLLTTVWTRSGELQALGILTHQMRTESSGIFSSSEKHETRHFAVYLLAEPLSTLDDSPRVTLGSLGGLPGLLLPEGVYARSSSMTVALPAIPLGWPELELSLWLTESLRAELAVQPTYPHYHLDLGAALGGGQELTANLQLIKEARDLFFALGVSDRVEINTSLALSAGFYPLVVDLTERKLGGLYGWVQAELTQDKVYGSMKGIVRMGSKYIQGTLGYRFTPDDVLFLNYTGGSGDYSQFSLGYRREF